MRVMLDEFSDLQARMRLQVEQDWPIGTRVIVQKQHLKKFIEIEGAVRGWEVEGGHVFLIVENLRSVATHRVNIAERNFRLADRPVIASAIGSETTQSAASAENDN